jgi:hypothetical protein
MVRGRTILCVVEERGHLGWRGWEDFEEKMRLHLDAQNLRFVFFVDKTIKGIQVFLVSIARVQVPSTALGGTQPSLIKLSSYPI